MYIKQISIRNYRNFGDAPFIMRLKPFTLLLGENNVGKTNLLNAIALLFSQEIAIAQRRVLDMEDFNYSTVVSFKKQVATMDKNAAEVVFPEVIVDADLIDFDPDQEAVVGDWFVDSALDSAQVTYRFALRGSFDRAKWIGEQRSALQTAMSDAEPETATPRDDAWKRVDFPIRDYRYTVYGGGDPSNECAGHQLGMLRAEILDALRDARLQLMAGGEQRLLYRVLRQGADSNYGDLKQRLSELEECIKTNPSLKELKNAVEILLNRVSLRSGPQDNVVDFQFSSPEATELLKKIGMIYGVDPVNVARNGLGRNNLLYLSLVLSQLVKSESPSDDAYACFRFVGIEEPEAHLHPHLQDHLARNVEALRDDHDKSLQLLLTSHSTHIAAKLRLSNAAILFQESPNGSLKSHYILDGLDESKDEESIRYLSLYLDATKSRMFFARCLILVEGISEQVIVPRLFEIHTGGKQTLEAIGATIVNVNGVSFRHFLKIVRNGYFRRCVVLTDRDTAMATNQRGSELKAEFDKPNLIEVEMTDDATFEKDLIASNRNGLGKQILLQALQRTKPVRGKELAERRAQVELDVDEFFTEIENYKAEFAFNLARALDNWDCGFSVPPYISSAFKFVS
jgi:putative ATP-dependent endonuclease of the OLD family